jgi:hypothetical protein
MRVTIKKLKVEPEIVALLGVHSGTLYFKGYEENSMYGLDESGCLIAISQTWSDALSQDCFEQIRKDEQIVINFSKDAL